MTILMKRRGLLLGMASLLAAPAIVRAESLMPVRALPPRWTTVPWTETWEDVVAGRIVPDAEALEWLNNASRLIATSLGISPSDFHLRIGA